MKLRVFGAVKESLRESYSITDMRHDAMSGGVVALVAIPLGMALAIASGVAPQHGLYTVIVAGAVVALLGGSRFQVSGPTAAFVVILAPVTMRHGLGGLLLAGLLAGFILIGMGLARLGKLIEYIPHPVTTGFTAGIAVVIATLQLKDLLGLQIAHMPERFTEKVAALFRALGTASPVEFSIGAATLGFLIVWSRYVKRIPAPLVGLSLAALIVAFLQARYPEFEIATVGSRFVFELNGVSGHGIPPAPPRLSFPWSLPGPAGAPFEVSLGLIRELLPSAFAIAVLGAIESLLSAVIADGMAQTKTDPDAELIALGIGNVICPFFGGIPATGAIARTATNIRFGARSPFSSVFHALFALIAVIFLARLVSHLPMAALAALLILVAYNMSEAKHFVHIVKVAPKEDIWVLLFCFGLTIIFDMVIGVTAGVILAALLFMKHMAGSISSEMLSEGHMPQLGVPVPPRTIVYEISGPLFFGAAEKAVSAISSIGSEVDRVVFLMNEVPLMDVTGLVALETAVERLVKTGRLVVLVGIQSQPEKLIRRSELGNGRNWVVRCSSLEDALKPDLRPAA